MNDIIQRFLAYARPPKLQLEAANFNRVAGNALPLITSEAKSKGVHLIREFAENLPEIMLDRNQIEQVFLNLLQNSLHATDSGGTITLRTIRRSGDIVVEVCDTGHGIQEENRAKIFDLCFTTKSGGTGIGLVIVHRIVSQHGARLDVQSELGKGTTISIVFKYE
ncbi:MAG: PAS domain-containing sensor histidine kinase [bacterium]